tara:strand:+ start:336 stop:614 length:279 start_codon:yes stop_codon:yes gene_type:complete
MNIGSYTLPSKVLLAPMAGTSDKPFRIICKEQGAALTTSEMVVMKKHLLNTNKSKHRLDFFLNNHQLVFKLLAQRQMSLLSLPNKLSILEQI